MKRVPFKYIVEFCGWQRAAFNDFNDVIFYIHYMLGDLTTHLKVYDAVLGVFVKNDIICEQLYLLMSEGC